MDFGHPEIDDPDYALLIQFLRSQPVVTTSVKLLEIPRYSGHPTGDEENLLSPQEGVREQVIRKRDLSHEALVQHFKVRYRQSFTLSFSGLEVILILLCGYQDSKENAAGPALRILYDMAHIQYGSLPYH